MLIYLLLPLTILYCLFLSRIVIEKNNITFKSEVFIARNNMTLFLWSVLLLLLAVFKGVEVGTDYPMYYDFFVKKSYVGIVEPGVSFIYSLAIKYNSFLVFSLCVYILFIFFMFKGIQKNCPNYLISVLVFILTYTYLTSYNQLRQMIAVSILFCCVNYVVSNKYRDKLKYLVVILLAYLFHTSALVALIFLFIPTKKFNAKVVITLFLATIVMYFVPSLKNYIGKFIVGISGFYEQKYTGNLNYFFEVNKEKGLLQLIPVIVQMIILVTSLYFPHNKTNLKINYKLYNFSTNIVVINLCLYSLSGIEAIDRLQIYFSCFNIYFYSFLIHLLLNNEERFYSRLFLIFIIIFWIAYYFLRLSINISGIVPYSFFISK